MIPNLRAGGDRRRRLVRQSSPTWLITWNRDVTQRSRCGERGLSHQCGGNRHTRSGLGRTHLALHRILSRTQPAIVVECEAIKPERAPDPESCRIQRLRIAVYIDVHLAWIVFNGSLSGLQRKHREQIVGRKRYRVTSLNIAASQSANVF
jgi:hypothetical protein